MPLKKLTSLFTLDIRALSIMRILLGVICLVDLVFFSYSLLNSIIPLEVVIKDFFYQNYWSIYTISNNHIFYIILIIIHTSLTICYILGYKTKYTAPLFWFFTGSIQWANPLFTNAGSDVARLLIWWSIFLPINKIYSLDSGWKKAKTQDYKVSNIATLGIGLQVLSIYFFSYFLKTSDARRTEFSAIYYALSRDYFSTNLGYKLTNYYTLTQALTLFSIILELAGPLLYLFLPRRGKIGIALAFILFHIGFIFMMRLGSFPRYCIAGWIALLPSSFWNWIENKKNNQKLYKPYFWFSNYFTNIFLGGVILYTLLWNIRSTNTETFNTYFPHSLNKFWYILRIDQYRGMYAPHPGTINGRHQINGLYKNQNSMVNISNSTEPIYTTKPTHKKITQILPKIQWINFVVGTLTTKDPKGKYGNYFVQYLCRKRNDSHDSSQALKAIQLIYSQEKIQLPKAKSSIEDKYLGTRNCKK